jgi:hypothetical protein
MDLEHELIPLIFDVSAARVTPWVVAKIQVLQVEIGGTPVPLN